MGTLLMQPQDVVKLATIRRCPDVVRSQVRGMVVLPCSLFCVAAMLDSDRTQAVSTSKWGRRAGISVSPLPKEHRRRGCRRAQLHFWQFASWLSWPHARRSLLLSKRRLPLNPPIPASTSNSPRRAAPGWVRPVSAVLPFLPGDGQ